MIERFSDRIELSDPGTLLVSFEQLFQGGVSECRNPSLQKMFQMIGAGDKAGSGIDKIRRGWESQQWRSPTVLETTEPDRVKFVLPMVSLIPPESEARLRKLFGADFDTLTPNEIQALVTADLEGEVSNSRLQLIRMDHPGRTDEDASRSGIKGFLGSDRSKAWNHLSAARLGFGPCDRSFGPCAGASALAPGASALAPGASALAPEASAPTEAQPRPTLAENDPGITGNCKTGQGKTTTYAGVDQDRSSATSVPAGI